MLFDNEVNDFRQRAGGAGQGLAALIQIVAFVLRPRVFAVCFFILLFIGLSQDVHGVLLLPIGVMLIWFGVMRRLREDRAASPVP
jgi:hypothetical protein